MATIASKNIVFCSSGSKNYFRSQEERSRQSGLAERATSHYNSLQSGVLRSENAFFDSQMQSVSNLKFLRKSDVHVKAQDAGSATEKEASVPEVAPAKTPTAPKAAAAKAEDAPKPKAAPKPKPVVKSIGTAMAEDIIPQLSAKLGGVEDLLDLKLNFVDNQLRGSFSKNEVPYAFWCYFPDGTLSGARGFSLATHGGAPSTVEPFIIDEKKITAELVVFWVTKRLFAQKLLSLN